MTAKCHSESRDCAGTNELDMAVAVFRNYLTKLQLSVYSHSISSRLTASASYHNCHQVPFLANIVPDTRTATIFNYRKFSDDPKVNVLHSKSNSSIEDFRLREEKREEEYSSQHKSSTNNYQNDDKIQEVRSNILKAALPFVANYGWSRETIAKGAESIGYPGVVHGMFPNGGIELVHNFYLECNQQLIEQLKVELEKNKNQNPMKFVTRAVQLRLQMIEPFIAHWPQALGLMSLPPNVPTSLAQLLTLVDDICFYAGDRSVDFGWYTRRIGLATIYKMTELYMLQDKSIEHQDTWTFLERRVEEGHQLQEVLTMGDETTKNALNSAFLTARNILGINFNRR